MNPLVDTPLNEPFPSVSPLLAIIPSCTDEDVKSALGVACLTHARMRLEAAGFILHLLSSRGSTYWKFGGFPGLLRLSDHAKSSGGKHRTMERQAGRSGERVMASLMFPPESGHSLHQVDRMLESAVGKFILSRPQAD